MRVRMPAKMAEMMERTRVVTTMHLGESWFLYRSTLSIVITNVCLVPAPCLCHGTTYSKAARNKPRDGGEEGEGGITGHQQLGQVDQESHRSTKYVADTKPPGKTIYRSTIAITDTITINNTLIITIIMKK